ncbi:hypothetical protein I7I50_01194 [Histoplasma capsulatum G186AR]|uniref:Uncharacterized protein n=1 Tax=Ajellomyces capsulatus TaxID=5037 RepID=A0A8H8D2P7_AJECA|nr:hypothetical protein I7I52_08978 [Histoplasma capsulatum]QSS73142.1 hypothetical protein I7I50_01194 [Histoplasma capsulatum G186AR]
MSTYHWQIWHKQSTAFLGHLGQAVSQGSEPWDATDIVSSFWNNCRIRHTVPADCRGHFFLLQLVAAISKAWVSMRRASCGRQRHTLRWPNLTPNTSLLTSVLGTLLEES